MIARFGGEEFALLIVGSNEDDCFQRVDLIRQQLQEAPFKHEKKPLTITVSAGISTYGNDGISLDELLLKADQRLYLAKDKGRNFVVDSNNQQEVEVILKTQQN